jgi:hypothetical protein
MTTQIQPVSTTPQPIALVTDDQLMGQQLTEQYHRAVGAMREVLRFGCMMMRLQENLFTREQVSLGGRGNKDGVSEWLRVNAPEVNRTTAYRFLHVAEAIAEQFQTPAKISFIDLATKSAEELPEKYRPKQSELWEFVDGTSQRSWLDAFKPRLPLGGDTRAIDPETGLPINHKARRTAEDIAREEYEQSARGAIIALKCGLRKFIVVTGPKQEPACAICDDHELQQLKEAAYDVYQSIKDYTARRPAMVRAEVARISLGGQS